MDKLLQDTRYALRMLRSRPGFTLIAAATLAIGIGANTAIFSVVNAILFQSLPFRQGERLVRLYDERRRDNGQVSRVSFSARNFYEVRAQARSFEAVAAQIFLNVNLTLGEGSERIVGIGVSDGWLTTLGVKPALGRGFIREEEEGGNRSHVALVSHGFWERRLGSDPGVIGRVITLDGASYNIIGVLPRAFDYPYHAEVWLPWTFDRTNGRAHPLNVQARLRDGVTLERAQVELDTIALRLAQSYPETNTGYSIRAIPLRTVLIEGGDTVVLVLMGAVGFLLLVACANVASLLLSQAVGRRKEFAIRAAVGASRARQLRQFLTENLLLAGLGGLAGLVATFWFRDFLMALVPKELTYVMREVPVSRSVMWFGFLISVCVGALLALVPMIRASRLDILTMLKEGGGSRAGDSGDRWLNGLVVGEVAIALILLAGGGLMIQNLYRLQHMNLGLATDHLLTMKLAFPESGYGDPQRRADVTQRLVEQIEAVPGISGVAAANLVPLTGGNVITTVIPEGRPFNPNEQLVASYRLVTPKYFSTLRIPVLRGRSFMDQDTASAQRVAIVSESTARRYWAGEDPVGKGIRTQRSGIDSPPMIVVGVANDVDEPTPSRKEIQETIYVPFAQGTSNDGTWATSSIQFAVRTTGEPLNTVASVQRAVWQVDQRLPIFDIATADRLYNDALSQTRAGAGTILCFSVFGLLLAALGTYGVFSYSVGCRTREIGIRTALGAVPGDVLWLVMRRGASLALVGVALGTAGVFALTKVMASILSQIRPGDPVTLAFAASLLISVALLACYIPARRAASVDPTEALRCE